MFQRVSFCSKNTLAFWSQGTLVKLGVDCFHSFGSPHSASVCGEESAVNPEAAIALVYRGNDGVNKRPG
jgi:hypothetical protein